MDTGNVKRFILHNYQPLSDKKIGESILMVSGFYSISLFYSFHLSLFLFYCVLILWVAFLCWSIALLRNKNITVKHRLLYKGSLLALLGVAFFVVLPFVSNLYSHIAAVLSMIVLIWLNIRSCRRNVAKFNEEGKAPKPNHIMEASVGLGVFAGMGFGRAFFSTASQSAADIAGFLIVVLVSAMFFYASSFCYYRSYLAWKYYPTLSQADIKPSDDDKQEQENKRK